MRFAMVEDRARGRFYVVDRGIVVAVCYERLVAVEIVALLNSKG